MGRRRVNERRGLAAPVAEARDDRLRFPVAEQQRVLGALVAASVAIRSLTPLTASLEDVYVRVTQASMTPHAPLILSAHEAEGLGGSGGGDQQGGQL